MVNFSRSLLLADIRDLIKVLPSFPLGQLIVKVFGNKPALPGAKNFRLDKSPRKLFQCHAVVAEKARKGNGGGGEDAQPACRLLSDRGAEAKVHADGQPHAKGRTKKLTGRQAKKDRFLMLPHFFGNFDFDVDFSLQMM